MAILSDRSIRRLAEAGLIEPYAPHRVQPASVDVILGREFQAPGRRPWTAPYLVMPPGDFVLAHTVEVVNLPNDVVGMVNGKSTWGRRGLMVHATAGFLDPGFRGQVVLELSNISDHLLTLMVGMAVAQLAFQWLDEPAERPYGHPELGSHYQDQRGARGPAGASWSTPRPA